MFLFYAVQIQITHGYSKDHRPDLKQFVISLVMSDSLPVFIRALSGNTSDKNHFREIVQEYGQSLQEKWGEDKIWIWDSVGYSEKNLGEISESYKWIMRVPETLSEALKAYKEQQYAERGFRFLKDPLFFAHSMFLERESRIVAMVMMMGLALMVYAIAEKKLREALEKENETIPDQRNKPTKKPTMRRVFQVFEGITVLYRGSEMVKILNLKPIHGKILALLGREYGRVYCTSYG